MENNYIYQLLGHLESLISQSDVAKKNIKGSLSEKVNKITKSDTFSSLSHDKSTVKKLVQKLRQNDNNTDTESVKDLVHNLTNLALAITEERFDKNGNAAGLNTKKKLTVSASEGHNTPTEDTRSGDEFFAPGEKKYERKFHSLDKKLKRTNLMRRRESQALLEGIRKSRQSNTNIMSDSYTADSS